LLGAGFSESSGHRLPVPEVVLKKFEQSLKSLGWIGTDLKIGISSQDFGGIDGKAAQIKEKSIWIGN
jgi:hypothetical protein